MSESEGGSRRARKRGLGLFKRRRQPTQSRTTQPNDRRHHRRTATSQRGDLCQMGEAMGKPSKARAGGWGWLLGQKRTRPSQQSSARWQPNPATAFPEAQKTPVTNVQAGVRSPLGRLPRPTEGSTRRSPIAPLSFSAPDAANSRSRRHPRHTPRSQSPTRLQANQPTLIQASTSFQRDTLLQGREPQNRDIHDRVTELEPRRRARLRREERPSRPSRPLPRSLAIALYAARMLILSVGIGVLAGTVLSAWNPTNNPFFSDVKSPIKQANALVTNQAKAPVAALTQLTLNQELTPVKTAIQAVAQQYPGFTPGVFLLDLDTNQFVDWSGTATFSSASMIKLPILVAFFQDVDAGKIRLDEKLTMRKDLVAPESGEMQYLAVGSQFTALETATKMITISDNTASNMLIDRLGGIQALDQRFKSWGLTTTQISNPLPDLKGTNTSSPKELATLLVRVSQGELVSMRSRDRMLDIMRRTINNSQLPPGLGEGAIIAHKTGDIATTIGDVGLVDMPSGKRYAVAVMIKRSENDDRAYELVQKISRVIYQHLAAGTSPKRGSAATPSTKPDAEASEETGDADVNTQHTPDDPSTTSGSNPTQAAAP